MTIAWPVAHIAVKVTLIGTAEGKEIQEPQEKVKFVEDMTVEERAKAMGENLKGPLPVRVDCCCPLSIATQGIRRGVCSV